MSSTNTVTSANSYNTLVATYNSNDHLYGGYNNIYTGIDPNHTHYPNVGTWTTTGTGTISSPVIPTSKRCRDCNHAHLNDQCVEFQDWGGVTFVKCSCKEYAPKDNLEYLEHLYDKKQRKESTPPL